MKSINKVTLLGFLGADPELSQGKIPFVSLSLATSDSWFDKATQTTKENTVWHRVTIFNEYLKDIALKSLKKGSRVYIEGHLQKSTYKDKEGREQTSWSITLPSFKGELIPITEAQASPSAGYNHKPYVKPGSSGKRTYDGEGEMTADDLPF